MVFIITRHHTMNLTVNQERNNFRSAFQPDGLRSFSHFPPSIYRRGLAASRIQRAWRRRNGRKFRKEMRLKMEQAALVIQKFSKRLLNEIYRKKNDAAATIQRNWRIKMYILMRLLCKAETNPFMMMRQTLYLFSSFHSHSPQDSNNGTSQKCVHNSEKVSRMANVSKLSDSCQIWNSIGL